MAKETAQLADYAASCRYEDIPPDVVERAKQCITDTVAAVIFGYDLPWSRMVVAFAAMVSVMHCLARSTTSGGMSS